MSSITSGPFAVAKHPLYTSVGLLVLPAAGILLGTWLGVVIGVALYVGARLFAPAEEQELRRRFGTRWDAYQRRVMLPWLSARDLIQVTRDRLRLRRRGCDRRGR